MPNNIVTIGVDIPGDQTRYASLKSGLSLLDYDIVIFNPCIYEFYGYYEEYLGKPCLSDSNSFQLKENIEHWRREILEALKAGKNVFMLLNEHEEVYVATGEKSYTGTGRNRQTTRNVTLYTNYIVIPGGIGVTNSKGTAMTLDSKGNVLSSYWAEIGESSEFRVLVEGKGVRPLVVTKSGGKIVGAYLRYKDASGALVLLPYIDFMRADFTHKEGKQTFWTDEAVKLGKKFVYSIVGVDKTLRQAGEITPAPEWVAQEKYILPKERVIGDKLLTVETKIEELQKEKESCRKKLAEETVLKSLLYEKGKPLELAILETLKLIGFNSTQYKDSESEFDVVFESEEGRLIGEVEGKDNKPINIDKLRQLEMNINEDFARDNVIEMAKGALIGNAYRLSDPDSRDDFFTQKCLTAADRSKTALVRATDLFRVARYLSGKNDKVFAKECRQAIIDAIGIVTFPDNPEEEVSLIENVIDDSTN